MDNHVEETVKDDRLQRLQALLSQQQYAFQRSLVGKSMDVLIEKAGRVPGQMVGRSPWLQPVIIDVHGGQIGDIINVRIIDTGTNSLIGVRTRRAMGL